MNIELPPTRPYGALFAVGSRLSGTALQTIGSVIVKAGYLLNASAGANTHVLVADPDTSASALVLADQGALFADPDDGMDVTREADIAPFKPLADIVVEGFRSGDLAGAEIRVDGITWVTRSEGVVGLEAASTADRGRHLFGYQPRGESPRQGDADADPTDRPVSLVDFDNYSNRFLNFHRRGGGFAATAAVAAGLTSGQRITLRKAGADALSVTLALPPLTALYRTWCGDGPDKAPYWTRIQLGAMRADTLILGPDAGRAEVIWRVIWPWADQPKDRYRAIRVSDGSL